MLKGLIFDVDGVITDSASYHLAAWRALATKLGIDLPAAADDQLRGRSRMDSLNVILRFGNQLNRYSSAKLNALAAEKNAMYQQLIVQMTPADILPGMLQLLKDARSAKLLLAVASASQNAPRILQQLGLITYFDAIVDPTALHKGKPDPEIYVAAQSLLKLNADEVISFEDASAGVAAIKAAGQFAVGIGDAQVLRAADYIVPDTRQLKLSAISTAFIRQQIASNDCQVD
ncbi:beta-phosphoglucomutase [Lacticaseibacillus zhaodongensis]|uniref:beta-phosphoglucomutase n=1 Tax=Lacticaseibacillus zhaodongensis TaxID=2668065 RepID=UPI0012D2A40B|nr:beta-phosphoglucomutase [Lacticaseibacillus zhaodongensis]